MLPKLTNIITETAESIAESECNRNADSITEMASVQTRARRTGLRRLALAPARRGPSGAPRHNERRAFPHLAARGGGRLTRQLKRDESLLSGQFGSGSLLCWLVA